MRAGKKKSVHYNILVNNKPGELARVTKLILQANIGVAAMRIADCGDKASIQFSKTREARLSGELKLARARVEGH